MGPSNSRKHHFSYTWYFKNAVVTAIAMPSQFSYLTLCLLSLAVYFMWMDVALYVNVQQVPPMATDKQPTHANISDYSYSPFYPITIKLLLQGPTIHYIDVPLSYWFMNVTSLENLMSANAVSVVGVCFAAAAARMFLSESVRVRQIGVVLFKARDFMDSLDGFVARASKKQVAQLVEPGTSGYYFDGVCDGLADTMVFLSLALYFYRHYGPAAGNYAYTRLENKGDGIVADSNGHVGGNILPMKASDIRNMSLWRRLVPPLALILCIAFQTIESSALWNTSMLNLQDTLEGMEVTTEEAMAVQNHSIKSSTMWMIVYFWRLLNPHTLMQFILLSVLYNRTHDYLTSVQFLGFLPITVLGIVSNVYSNYARSGIAAAEAAAKAVIANKS